jgi:hypothetical protein
MENNEYEQEFERNLFDIMRTYSQYLITKRSMKALEKSPTDYMESGTLLVPTHTAQQELTELRKSREALWKSLEGQALSLQEPVTGILPSVKRYDLTYTPKVVNEIVDAMCQFVHAATTTFNTAIQGDVNIYDDDEERY